MAAHAASTAGLRIASNTGFLDDGGSSHISAIAGAPSTMSGAATTMRSSCCTMWAAKSAPLIASSGETSATTSASQPHANAAAWPRLTPDPTPAVRHKRRRPIA